MPIDCPNHYQSRISVTMAGNNLVHRAIYPPPVRYQFRTVQPPWQSKVRWSWGNRYRNITSFWALICPIRLGVEISSGRRYIYATDANGQYRSGQYLGQYGRGFPSYRTTESPSLPQLHEYVSPPPPAIHYLDLWSNDNGGGGNFEQTWSQSGEAPKIDIECSCNTNNQIQCGDMRPNPDEDDWCCLNCSSINSTFNGWATQIENLKDRLVP